jgi:hypothetical protein
LRYLWLHSLLDVYELGKTGQCVETYPGFINMDLNIDTSMATYMIRCLPWKDRRMSWNLPWLCKDVGKYWDIYG